MATTTEDGICERAIVVIEALSPTFLATKFRRYRNEGEGDFIAWADADAAGALRRFQVLPQGTDQPIEISNGDLETHFVELVVLVAYPKNGRYGARGALDRLKVMDDDRHRIEVAIGLDGAANFSPPFADATWRGGSCDRQSGRGCDFLVIRQTMSFLMQMT